MDEIRKGARIRLTDRWELRAYDCMNWATWTLSSEGNWKRTGNYFQNVGDACAFVLERELKDGGDMDAAAAVDRLRATAAQLKAALA